jgi:hypothetical protein
MTVLVDYDNIQAIEKQRGVLQAITHVVQTIASVAKAIGPRVNVRLYGGWFEQMKMSRSALTISPQVSKDFPQAMTLSVATSIVTTIVNVEMAYSLIADPQRPFTHTYRPRAAPLNIRSLPDPFADCASHAGCPIGAIHAFLRDQKCPTPGCNVSPERVLLKPEQKLVDVMIAVDLLYLSANSKEPIALVSTDEDFWPAVQFSLVGGCELIHLHPVAGRRTPQHYSRYATSNYVETCF